MNHDSDPDPASRTRYRRKDVAPVVAVQFDLETDGFTYRKWGGEQRCKPGDWLVNNDGEVYTVDKDSFAATYMRVGPGQFQKQAPVWAQRAATGGSIRTKDGSTEYREGDFLVFNDADGRDGYAIEADRFHSLYEPAD